MYKFSAKKFMDVKSAKKCLQESLVGSVTTFVAISFLVMVSKVNNKSSRWTLTLKLCMQSTMRNMKYYYGVLVNSMRRLNLESELVTMKIRRTLRKLKQVCRQSLKLVRKCKISESTVVLST